MSVKPEDILADAEDYTVVNGVKVRKGTIAAIFANLSLIEDSKKSLVEKEKAKEQVKELLPGLIALGIADHIIFRNREIQSLVETMKESVR